MESHTRILRMLICSTGAGLLLVGIAVLAGWASPLYEYISQDGVVGETGRFILRAFGLGCAVLGVLLSVFSWKFKGIVTKVSRLAGAAGAISRRKWLTLIFLLSLILRTGWVVYLPADPVSDFADYDRIASGLAGGVDILSPEFTAVRPPGYPVFLAVFYRVFGHRYLPVKLANALLGSLLAVLVYFLSRRAASESIARLASAIAAIYPTFIFSTSLLATENLSTPLFVLSLLIFAVAYEKGSYGWMAAGGAVFGITCLVRPAGSAYPALFVAWLLLHRVFSLKKRMLLALSYVLAFVLLIFPWLWRNHHVFGRWGIMGTNMGLAVLHTNHPEWETIVSEVRERSENEYEVDRELMRKALDYIRRHPGFYFRNIPRSRYQRLLLDSPEWLAQYNLARVRWDERKADRFYPVILYSSSVAYYLVLIFALLGIFRAGRSSVFNSLFLWVILFNVFNLILVIGAPRYRHYMMPIFIHFSAVAIATVAGKTARAAAEAETRA